MASFSQHDSPQSSSPLVQRNRRRGAALSCAECRRLKLKCSRVFPCSNCVKKGCGAICPDGSLTTGKGNRFVLANTEVLHDKISQLATRVRQLEDALAHSHSIHSIDAHPLLSEELLQIKRPLERERLDAPPSKEEKPDTSDTIDAMGSLSISQRGRSTFFGQTANSWYLLRNEEGSDEDEKPPRFEPPLPSDVPWLAYAFPFTSSVNKSVESVRASLLSLLPNIATARRLSEIYYRHAAWMYTPISDTDFHALVFRPIYEADVSYSQPVPAHNLAILFMVLALGILLDLDRPSHSHEATQYYQLGRAALTIDSVFEEQSIPAIQALLLMCHYMFLDDIEGPRWAMMGLVVKLAQSVGLHRDSGKWNLDPDETRRRRCLLWEIFTYDSWQSLTYGRPPSFSLAHIDTKKPHTTVKGAQGETEMSFAVWKHSFCSDCLSVVQDQAFGARAPSYKMIQEMDKQVRTFYFPPSLQVPGFGGTAVGREPEQPTIELTMQRYIAFSIREITLFYLHRGFFARALEDNPVDPLGSKYAPSVLAAYGSACSFVGLINSLYKQHPALTERMWFLFTHVFSCSIVLGSIASKVQMAIAPSALSQLESAYQLFESTTEVSRKSKILPILQKLKERARVALSPSLGHNSLGSPSSAGSPSIKTEEDELAALGGMTRLVSRKSSSTPSSPYSGSSPMSNSSSPPPQVPGTQEQATTYQAISEPSTNWPIYSPQIPTYVEEQQQYTSYPRQLSQQSEGSAYDLSGSQNQAEITFNNVPDYYGYQNVSAYFAPDYNGQFDAGMPNPNEFSMPAQDVSDSWQNLYAQYKPM